MALADLSLLEDSSIYNYVDIDLEIRRQTNPSLSLFPQWQTFDSHLQFINHKLCHQDYQELG
jgi:hypothetical protein